MNGPTRLYLDQAMQLCGLDPDDRKERDAFRSQLDDAGALMPKRRPKEGGRRRRRVRPWTTVYHLHDLKLIRHDPRLSKALEDREREINERLDRQDDRIDEIVLGQKLVMEAIGEMRAENESARKRSKTAHGGA